MFLGLGPFHLLHYEVVGAECAGFPCSVQEQVCVRWPPKRASPLCCTAGSILPMSPQHLLVWVQEEAEDAAHFMAFARSFNMFCCMLQIGIN